MNHSENPGHCIQSIVSLLEAAEGTLRYYAGAGCKSMVCENTSQRIMDKWTAPDCLALGPLPRADAGADVCAACPLYDNHTRPVSAREATAPGLLLIPGYPSAAAAAEDDPFAGEDGGLLARIITAGMKLALEDVGVHYLVKCCPPDNSPPEAMVVNICRRQLEDAIQRQHPRVICTLGDFAAKGVLETDTPLPDLRGQHCQWQGIPVVPTWHPAQILDDTGKKREAWEDVKAIMKILGLPL